MESIMAGPLRIAPPSPTPAPSRLRFASLLAALALVSAPSWAEPTAKAGPGCGQPGQWWAAPPGAGPLEPGATLAHMARQQVALLGEQHDSAEDHRWQLQVLAQLHGLHPELAIGLEMFPRRLQPVLDEWVAGGLSETAFLTRSEWHTVWGFDARDYLPLFHYARMNRIPMLAMNVERSVVEALGQGGWEAVAEDRREGVSRPAPPLPEYRALLAQIYDMHPGRTPAARDAAAFERFVLAQGFWDRAMAERMAAYFKQRPDALVVGILGAGHVRQGHGVAHQLRALGVVRVGALLTWPQAQTCADIVPGLADGLFVVAPPQANPPRLGVAMEDDPAGVRIAQVVPGSVAEQAGLKVGDVVLQAAGAPVGGMSGLRGVVQRQAPGTWLPLKVRRDGQEQEIVARFPAGA